jgi:hypothetical protein
LTGRIEWNKIYFPDGLIIIIEVNIAFKCPSFDKTGWVLAVVYMPGLFFCFIFPKNKSPISAIHH